MIPKFRAWFPAPCGVNRLFYKKYGTYRYTCSWSISGPSRGGQVLIQTGKSIAHYIQNNKGFPSPLEVDRFLYPIFFIGFVLGLIAFPSPLEVEQVLFLYTNQKQLKPDSLQGFRPLSRQIGSYTNTLKQYQLQGLFLFPSPLEVDRFLYRNVAIQGKTVGTFPSPREVDRFLYQL